MKKLLVILAMLMVSLLIVGCSNDSNKNDENNKVKEENVKVNEDNQNEVDNEDLENTKKENKDEVDKEVNYNKEAGLYTYTVFRSDEEALNMVKDKLEETLEFTPYPYNKENIDQTMKFLFNELKETNLPNAYASVPEEVNLIGASVNDYVLTLNFDNSLYNVQGSTGDIMFIDTLMSTIIANLKDVRHIYIEVNGERIDVLNHLDVSDGFGA